MLDFINKGDLLNQTCTMRYTILNLMGGNFSSHQNVTKLFENIEDMHNVLSGSDNCEFARKVVVVVVVVVDYWDTEEWVFFYIHS